MRTITVVGHGTASAAPDCAEVRVVAVHRDPALSAALAGAESARDRLVDTARLHVDETRIASTNLRVWPAHDNEGRPDGFEARHSLTIRCDDITQAGALVTALAEEVGDRLHVEYVSLMATDPGDALGLAREAAFADARSRGAQLAGLAGASLGEVQSVSEGAGAHPDHAFALAASSDTRLARVSFEPGEQAISTSVTVVFELSSAG